LDTGWSARVQELSSKPGCASGVSELNFQLVSAGSVTGAGPGTVPVSEPSLPRVVATGRPFQVTWFTPAGAQTVSGPGLLVSPVSARVPPCEAAERTR
jgi:hypothetical protein